jgi:ABC-type phosphate/phosphonate transport system substrate-binding protein
LLIGLCLSFLAGGPLVFGADQPKPESPRSPRLRFGMIKSLFRAADEGTVLASTKIFSNLILMQTGVRADFSVVEEPAELARCIDAGELDFGVLHGVEYGWVKERYPQVKPLVIAYNKTWKLRAHVLVRADSPCEGVADLRGKNLLFPRWSLNHVHLYLHKAVEETGSKPDVFFGGITSPHSVETAIDDLVDGAADATIVDGIAYDHYRQQKPVRATRLKVLAESEVFPSAALVYNPQVGPKTAASKLQEGLVTAHERPLTRELLMLWRLSQFSKVPTEYDDFVAGVLKQYPQRFEPVRFVMDKEMDSVGAAR